MLDPRARTILHHFAILVSLASLASLGWSQAPCRIAGHVHDAAGRATPGARVSADGPGIHSQTTSDDSGAYTLDCSTTSGAILLKATTATMQATKQVSVPASQQIDFTLIPSEVMQQVTITATRSTVGMGPTANTIYDLPATQLDDYPAVLMDDKLRQQAGFELYRRSSSSVTNPTSQGISLRGLGSTAASRTLVLEDNVPMNDAFGAWIHWNEIPTDAVEAVTIATGGGSDLYGSSALGGVIDVIPARPSTGLFDVSASGGGQYTSVLSARGDVGNATWDQLLAVDSYRTNGYVIVAPSSVGPIDTPANLHYQAGRSETSHVFSGANRAFLVGNVLNEARANGTPDQTNATRLWRYIAADDWSATPTLTGRVRLFGSEEGYRQGFSSVPAAQTSETLTRRQRVRTQEIGGSTDAALALTRVAFVIGADLRDIRATDNEIPIANGLPNGIANTSARQRFIGGFGEALATRGPWSATASLRLDAVANFNTQTITVVGATPVPLADRSEIVPSPRFGIVRQLGAVAEVHASAFRAFRSPSMNELYRTGQIGQQTTQANSQLLSERATGWELGTKIAPHNDVIELNGTYFWTEINRPVSAVLLSSTATSQLLKRENLGQILSQGTELNLQIRPGKAISGSVGYQYAHAIVTKYVPPPVTSGSPQPSLVGNWIPEVPRQSFTGQVRTARPRLGELTLSARASGHVWDDSANTFLLHAFLELDLAARHDFGSHWTISTSLQNLTDQRPDVSKTPTPTLGSPLLVQAGIAFHSKSGFGN